MHFLKFGGGWWFWFGAKKAVIIDVSQGAEIGSDVSRW